MKLKKPKLKLPEGVTMTTADYIKWYFSKVVHFKPATYRVNGVEVVA